MKAEEREAAARVLRALANPNRLALFERIYEDGLCCDADREGNTVCVIAARFELALSTISHHLRELRDAGLITCSRRGRQVVCAVNREALERVRALLAPPAARRRARRRGRRMVGGRAAAGRAAAGRGTNQ